MRLDSLSAGTAISPDVPGDLQPVPFPRLIDLGADPAFVVTVLPLPDVFCDLNLDIARPRDVRVGFAPRRLYSSVEAFKSLLGPRARGTVSVLPAVSTT